MRGDDVADPLRTGDQIRSPAPPIAEGHAGQAHPAQGRLLSHGRRAGIEIAYSGPAPQP